MYSQTAQTSRKSTLPFLNLNEPGPNETANCVLLVPPELEATTPRAGQRGYYYLVAAQHVPSGEELTWHYGANYGRDYARDLPCPSPVH